MECILSVIVVAVLFVLVPLLQMLFGPGPNNIRKLVRLDLAAFLVLTAGVALSLAIVRFMEAREAACVLVIALPTTIALAWLGRYYIEDTVLSFRRKRQARDQGADLSFLSDPPPAGEIIEATIIKPPAEDSSFGDPPPSSAD